MVDVVEGLARLGEGVPAQGAEGGLDDHERVAHLVRDHGGEPPQGAEPVAQGPLPLESRDGVGEAVERPGEETRVLVVPAAGKVDLAREVAGGRHFAHGTGNDGEGPGHAPGHDVAEEHGHRHPRGRGQEQGRAERAQEAQALAAGAQHQDLGRVFPVAQGLVDGNVFVAVETEVGDPLALERRLQPRVARPGEGRCAHPALVGEGHVAPGEGLEARGHGVVEGGAEGQRAQDLPRLRHGDGNGHDLEEARGARLERRGLPAGERRADARGLEAYVAEGHEGPAPAVREGEDVRLHALPVVTGQRVDGGGIPGGEGGLEPGQVGHETGALEEDPSPVRVVLLDEGRRFLEPAAQLGLDLAGGARAQELQDEADGEKREQARGHEDAAAQRGQEAHSQRTTKSCSTVPPSGTRTARVSLTSPSFQAARV